MGNDMMIREDVLQLLREAECPEEFTRQFTAAMDQGSIPGQLKLLRLHPRQAL